MQIVKRLVYLLHLYQYNFQEQHNYMELKLEQLDEKLDRRAHFTMYTINDNELAHVERFAEKEEGFVQTTWGR